jgi:hypothetical protein
MRNEEREMGRWATEKAESVFHFSLFTSHFSFVLFLCIVCFVVFVMEISRYKMSLQSLIVCEGYVVP